MIGLVSEKADELLKDVQFLSEDRALELSDKTFHDLQNLIVTLQQSNNRTCRYILIECDELLLTFTRYRQHNIDTLGYRRFIVEVAQFVASHS